MDSYLIDRSILWLAGLSPLLVMLGVLLIPRWRKLPARDRRGEIFLTLILLAPLAAYIAYDLTHLHGSIALNVHIRRPDVLLLLIPLLGMMVLIQRTTLSGIARGRMWSAFLLRGSMLVLLLLAIAGLQMVVEQDTLTVMYALDVSKSVPESEQVRALKFIKDSLPEKQADDKVGLLVFGGQAGWQISPQTLFQAPDLKSFNIKADPDATNIAQALYKGSRTETDSRRRLVLFTDGRQTSGDALEALKRVTSMGVDVWIVPLQRGDNAEMLVEKVVVPNELLWEQPFDAHVFVYSNVEAEATVSLRTGDKSGDPEPKLVKLSPGKNRVTFPQLKMHSGGAKEIHAVVKPRRDEDDSKTENNDGYAYTDVQTDNRVLVLTSDLNEVRHLLFALEGEKMTINVRSAPSLPENPEEYRGYDCIILANVASSFFSPQALSVMKQCVEDQGAGLIMIGGDQSFGAGSWLGTPVEDVLPVKMDLENMEVMPSGALCIVLHTCEFADGNAWGKKISKAAIKTLSPRDYAGLIYYSHMAGESWAFKPRQIHPDMFGKIDNADPGDMPSLEPIVKKATDALANLPNVSLKHCIVITDGDPSPPTSATLAAAKKAAITISIITIFPHGGADVGVMKDVALQTGGRYYSADDPRKLPQIFIKEAAVVRKSLVRSDEKGIPISLGVPGPTLRDFGAEFPKVYAFVVTDPKPRAELQLFTMVEGQKMPILMSWQKGLGKTVAFTSDCTNRWGNEWVKWGGYKKFWTNMISWASRQRMPTNHTVTTRIEGGKGRVIVEGLDAKGNYINFAKLIGTAIDPDVAKNNPDGKTHELVFTMTAPGRYEATFPVQKAGAYPITIIDQTDPKKPNAIVTGLANSYSPEFLHLEGDEAMLVKLGEIATPKGGVSRLKELAKLDPKTCGVYAHDLPPTRQPTDLFWPLMLIALCLFPFDVAVRRLAFDPEKFFLALAAVFNPVLRKLRLKKQQLQDAATEVLSGGKAPPAPPPDIVPTGSQSRQAQSMYEQAGQGAEFNLNPTAQDTESKPVVGGTKVSPADTAASEYTGALLKAKKRAKKGQ